MPSCCRAVAFVACYVGLCLLRGKFGCLARVETDGDYFEVPSDVELQHVESACQPIQNLVAKHRAVVIHERDNQRLLTEIVAVPYSLSVFILKQEIKGHLLIELLIDAH